MRARRAQIYGNSCDISDWIVHVCLDDRVCVPVKRWRENIGIGRAEEGDLDELYHRPNDQPIVQP